MDFRLLRNSDLDLEIETLKENSHLILDLDSQICCKNSHSHSQLSLSSSQKFEKSRLILVDLIGNFFKITLQVLCFNHKDSITKSLLKCTLSFNQTLILEKSRVSFSISTLISPQNSHSHSRLSIFLPELSFSFSTLKNFLEKSHSRSRLSVNILSQKSRRTPSRCDNSIFTVILY